MTGAIWFRACRPNGEVAMEASLTVEMITQPPVDMERGAVRWLINFLKALHLDLLEYEWRPGPPICEPICIRSDHVLEDELGSHFYTMVLLPARGEGVAWPEVKEVRQVLEVAPFTIDKEELRAAMDRNGRAAT